MFIPCNFQQADAQTQHLIKSKQMERQARQFLHMVRESTSFSADIQINNYISSLANKLARNSQMDSEPLHYFVINDPSINAFAGLGATFFINTGIIGIAQNEGEIASVMAHELAHHKQAHLSRLFENYKTTLLPSLAAILAGIAVGGDAGIAAIAGAQAARIESMIDYTLAYEREADAVGLQILTASGYSPVHAKKFMLRLEQEIREQGLIQSNIHNTHPVTPERIASFEARVNRYENYVDQPVSSDFYFVKARNRILFNWEANRTFKYFENKLVTGSDVEQLSARYGYALSLSKDGDTKSARKEVARLLNLQPDNSWFLTAAAEIELHASDPDAAKLLLSNNALAPDPDVTVVGLYTRSLIRSGDLEIANRYIRKHIVKHPKQLQLYKLLGETAAKTGDVLSGYLAESDYHFRLGDLELALQQLRVAESKLDDYYSKEIIREKKRLIQEEISWRNL